MVKVKAICRNEKEYVKQTNSELQKVQRAPSTSPILHPFQKAREYKRALNAAKLEKVFAKPFICAMNDHSDGITVMSKNRFNLVDMISGSADGEIIFWNIPERKPIFQINAHLQQVRGLAFANNNQLSSDTIFVSAGDDTKIHLWSLNKLKSQLQNLQESQNGLMIESNENKSVTRNYQPRATYNSKHLLTYVDHSFSENLFATSGSCVQVWNYERSVPLQTFQWGVDTVTKLKFNPSQVNLIAAVAVDRSICLYDIRGSTPINKIYMKNKSAAICWNPQEPMNFVIGNENGNCYTFDMRKPEQAKMIHKDHISAILDVDFAPTGREFVSASFDKTIRIFPINNGRSREIYHTKRMQQVNSIIYTMDSRFIISGSEDTNIRIWKSRADHQLKQLLPREKESLAYSDKLKNKYRNNPEIKRILRHKHLPALIKKKKGIIHIQRESRHKKDINMRANNRPEDRPFIPSRNKDLDKVQE